MKSKTLAMKEKEWWPEEKVPPEIARTMPRVSDAEKFEREFWPNGTPEGWNRGKTVEFLNKIRRKRWAAYKNGDYDRDPEALSDYLSYLDQVRPDKP